jgi:hypothetical protein
MSFSKRIYFFITVFVLWSYASMGQDSTIGGWESLLPYNTALSVATDGNMLYTACIQAFFTYNNKTGDMEAFSKVEGMSDIGMQCVGYDMATSSAILVYADGNIDIFKNNTFYNIPDLKLKNVSGEKTIYQVYTFNGLAYICSSLGILVVDLATHTIKDTYQFYTPSGSNIQILGVKSFIVSGDYMYAATTKGLYRINRYSPQVQNFQAWQNIDSDATHQYISMANLGDTLYLATRQSVFAFLADTTTLAYHTDSATIRHIDGGISNLFISEALPPVVRIMDRSFHITDTIRTLNVPMEVVQLLNGSIWVADSAYGLMQRFKGNELSNFIPRGPADAACFDIYAHNKELFIAHGNRNDISYYHDGHWKYYRGGTFKPFDTLVNFNFVTRDESNGTIYAGSYTDGLSVIRPDGSFELFRQFSILDPSPVFFGNGERQITGMTLDKDHNLWFTEYASNQLYLLTPGDSLFKFRVAGAGSGGPVVADDYGQLWFADQASGGVALYTTNGTPTYAGDDASYHLGTGVGNGNLPANNVLCLAKDKKNYIWIGTSNGIGIVYNCSNPPCDADIPIVQYDKYAGYLFAGNNVRTIAVDGANRKWIGTDDGIWLLSPSADKIISRFTTENSPLPSNLIRKIAVDDVTGDVYIGTDEGLISYRGTATGGGTTNSNVIAFPNPVPSGYSGTIAIKGLVENADVRITDINGQLVYKTTALGGQAVWNGKDYTGHRPQSGVYLFFVTNSDGSETHTGKIVFLQ